MPFGSFCLRNFPPCGDNSGSARLCLRGIMLRAHRAGWFSFRNWVEAPQFNLDVCGCSKLKGNQGVQTITHLVVSIFFSIIPIITPFNPYDPNIFPYITPFEELIYPKP